MGFDSNFLLKCDVISTTLHRFRHVFIALITLFWYSKHQKTYRNPYSNRKPNNGYTFRRSCRNQVQSERASRESPREYQALFEGERESKAKRKTKIRESDWQTCPSTAKGCAQVVPVRIRHRGEANVLQLGKKRRRSIIE